MVRLQEELQALALREAEAVKSLTELQQQVKELSDSWQVRPPGSPPGFLGPFAPSCVTGSLLLAFGFSWTPPAPPWPPGFCLCLLGPLLATSVLQSPPRSLVLTSGSLIPTSGSLIPMSGSLIPVSVSLILSPVSPPAHLNPFSQCLDPFLDTWVSCPDI